MTGLVFPTDRYKLSIDRSNRSEPLEISYLHRWEVMEAYASLLDSEREGLLMVHRQQGGGPAYVRMRVYFYPNGEWEVIAQTIRVLTDDRNWVESQHDLTEPPANHRTILTTGIYPEVTRTTGRLS